MMLTQHSVDLDWLFNTQKKVLRADWLILENHEKATLNINMPYLTEDEIKLFHFFYIREIMMRAGRM